MILHFIVNKFIEINITLYKRPCIKFLYLFKINTGNPILKCRVMQMNLELYPVSKQCSIVMMKGYQLFMLA